MRRFWQIDIDRNFKTMDFDAIENTDFLNFWKSIDEMKVDFIVTQDEKMIKYQETFKAVPPVQELLKLMVI